ncbi:hypothetical protein PFY10_06115 [Chryseobacterium daecheongense]|nr:hypothetical protein PFY10_06115 [Chryseobacterium daecheongense]
MKEIVLASCYEIYLREHNLSKTKKLKKVYLLAGPSFFEVAGGAIKNAIAEVKK